MSASRPAVPSPSLRPRSRASGSFMFIGQPVEWSALENAVTALGGPDSLTRRQKWTDVARSLGHFSDASRKGTTLRRLYEAHVAKQVVAGKKADGGGDAIGSDSVPSVSA